MKRYFRPTWAEIDLGALRYNYRQITKLVGKGVGVMVVVKGNAYGHGIVDISKTLSRLDVNYLGVATVDEAVLLRKEGIDVPILVLGPVFPDEVKAAFEHNVTLTLANPELFKIILRQANFLKKVAKVHIKIDTGMGRIGFWHEDDVIPFIVKVASCKFINIEGIYTHFSAAARDRLYTTYQIESFERFIGKLLMRGIHIPLRHAANSIAIVNFKRSHLNLVRPGLIIYGMYPKRNLQRLISLRPVLSLKTRIAHLKKVPPGRSISYGRTYITQNFTKIATLPIGYADGYGRILSNRAEVLVRGERAPVVGKVTMDQTMINVGHIKDVKLGDEVVLIGRQGSGEITAERLARLAGTIPYEIVCSITERVPRIYKR